MELILKYVEKYGYSILIIAIGWILAPFIKKRIIKLSKKATDKGILTFVASCVGILIKLISIVIALDTVGVEMSVIVGAFSAVGLGVSLALKDNMANVAAGMQILFTKPFTVGDYIQVDTSEGYVTRIEVMYIVLKTYAAQEIILPNSVVIQKFVTNYSRDQKRRIHVTIPIGLNADIEQIRDEFSNVLDKNSLILDSEEKKIVIEDFQVHSYTLGIFCWCNLDDYWNALYQINESFQKIIVDQQIPTATTKVQSAS